MSLRNIDIEGGMRRLAEKRIEDAMREGKFSNLPGMGKPIELEPVPAEENARLAWWALRILKRNDYTPDEVRWRKQVDQLKERLASATNIPLVEAIVGQINVLVHRINTLGTNALQSPVAPVDMQQELKRLQNDCAADSRQRGNASLNQGK